MTAAALLLSGAAPALGMTVRFRAESLGGGTIVAAHASASGEPSDAAAARRRAEIVRSPYVAVVDERVLRSGELRIGFDRGVPEEIRDAVAAGSAAFAASLFDRDGFSRVGSARSPLVLLVTAQADVPAAAGWESRELGLLVRPMAAAAAGGRDARAVVLDLAHQTALLSLRQTSADASAWFVEAGAEFLARRALGLEGDPTPSDDPLLAESGSLTDPPALAEFLPSLVKRLPRGLADLRAAWEDAGSRRGDESEPLLRALGLKADPRGVAGVLGDVIIGRLARTTPEDPAPGARRALPVGGFSAAVPGPLGWRRVALKTTDESGGVEIALPEAPRCAAGRAMIAYRGETDGFDAVDLAPGVPARIPVSGTSRLALVLVDGGDGGDPGELFVDLRRLPDYPAALSGSSAEWTSDAVRISWRTARHRDLLAWVISRVDETEGESREPVRRIVPTSEADDEGFAYQVDDTDVIAGHRYHYRVAALTTGGTLSEAFEATVVAER